MAETANNEAGRVQEAERQAMRERVLRVMLTSEARQRLSTLKMVKPDIAKLIEDHIIQQASGGKITRPITDEELKGILSSIQPPKREFKIRWA